MLKSLALSIIKKTPLPPPGTKVLAHVLPIDHRSFDPHAIKGFSVCLAMEHYRCFKIFIPSTGGIHIADTVIWFPQGSLKLPIPSKDELLCSAIEDLRTTLQSSVKNNILTPEGTTHRKKLIDLNDIFKNCDPRDPTTKTATPTDVPRVIVQQKDSTIVPRVQPNSNDTTIFPRLQPPADTPSTKKHLEDTHILETFPSLKSPTMQRWPFNYQLCKKSLYLTWWTSTTFLIQLHETYWNYINFWKHLKLNYVDMEHSKS